jgi:hypothetical protein
MFDYIKKYYCVPAEIGRKVVVNGRSGIIIVDGGNYIGVNFDDEKAGFVANCHPTWNVAYGGIGKVRKASKAAARYQRFLEYGDCFDSFIQFCLWDAEKERSWN